MKKIYLVLLLALLPLMQITAQEAKYKAVFTLNFIRYVGWPESSLKGDFVIGVIKNSEVARSLEEQSAGKKFGFQDIVVKEFKSVDELTDCQVIFVSSSINIRNSAESLMNKAKQNQSLIISESEGATKSGAAINFVIREGALKFELDKANAAKVDLKFSSRLEGMASAIVL
jgi:hypothetical protein